MHLVKALTTIIIQREGADDHGDWSSTARNTKAHKFLAVSLAIETRNF